MFLLSSTGGKSKDPSGRGPSANDGSANQSRHVSRCVGRARLATIVMQREVRAWTLTSRDVEYICNIKQAGASS